jgi:hypothetical protein
MSREYVHGKSREWVLQMSRKQVHGKSREWVS